MSTHRPARRPLGFVLVLVAVAALLASCGHLTNPTAEVDRAIANTVAVPRSFVYTETTEAATITVQGSVADDFRYKALVSTGQQPAFEEVVSDDAVADRVLSPDGLNLFRGTGTSASTTSGAAGVATGFANPSGSGPTPADALTAGGWVLDPAGAPSLLPSASSRHTLGSDPIYDSLTVFQYVDQAMHQAFDVRKYNPDDLRYRPQDDPFPRPAAGSGVTRYDLDRRNIPHLQQQAGNAANQSVPDAGMFRKMGIYVKNGRIIQVLEQIDVASRLPDLSKSYNITFKGSVQQSVDAAITAINSVGAAIGRDPIRVRTMSIKFVDFGSVPDVKLPAGATVGSLGFLENRGQQVLAKTGG